MNQVYTYIQQKMKSNDVITAKLTWFYTNDTDLIPATSELYMISHNYASLIFQITGTLKDSFFIYLFLT